jgi:UDP-galactopyranose mutase
VSKRSHDLIIVGAGPVGCVVARQAADQGWTSLVIDKRNHIAGNCHDRNHESGVLIHAYGPHYFRTNSDELLAFLSRFTDWVPGNYFVKSAVAGRLYPFPINLDTLEQFFGRTFTPESARKFLESEREKITAPANSEEFVLSRVGKPLYEAFYLGYTRKQWDVHPRDLAASVCGRIPVRFNRDSRYVDHKHQLTPAKGFTEMFRRMIDDPKIEVRLEADYRELRGSLQAKRATVYTGPVDEYFEHRLGKLPWRSLDFEFKYHEKEFVQPCVQINYPNEHPYTRSVEIKHVTQQEHRGTVISFETPSAIGDPYYPIPSSASERLFKEYQKLSEQETLANRVYFAGRLANYRYLNTDEAIESALKAFQKIREETEEVSLLKKAA